MKVWALLFVISISLVSTGQNLETTLKWINQTYNGGHRGLFQQWDRKGILQLEYVESFASNQCNITRTYSVLPDSEEAKFIWTKSDESTYNLRDIDPTTVKVVPHASLAYTDCTDPAEVKASELDCEVQAEVVFSTHDEAETISDHSVQVFQKIPENKPDHISDQIFKESHSSFGMYDTAYAKRFAKAFRHAVELCGGKPSSF